MFKNMYKKKRWKIMQVKEDGLISNDFSLNNLDYNEIIRLNMFACDNVTPEKKFESMAVYIHDSKLF